MECKTVSIIIPVYNAEKTIRRCLDSILRQSYGQFFCVCVDDGSKDNSAAIIEEFEKKDSRIKYLYQQNAGPGAARNAGIREAIGEYIVFVDSDDTINCDYLSTLVSAIEKKKSDFCACGYSMVGKESYVYNDFFPIDSQNQECYLSRLFKNTGGCICGGIYRLQIINDNCIRFNEKVRMCEDQLFKLQYFLKCDRFESIDYNGYTYYENSNGITHSQSYEKWQQQIPLIQCFQEILMEHGIREEDAKLYLEPKIKNVLISLTKNCDGNYSMVLDDVDINKLQKKIRIRNISDVKWILPLKMRCNTLIRMVYGYQF